jgi:hypothetical protein
MVQVPKLRWYGPTGRQVRDLEGFAHGMVCRFAVTPKNLGGLPGGGVLPHYLDHRSSLACNIIRLKFIVPTLFRLMGCSFDFFILQRIGTSHFTVRFKGKTR